MHGVDETRFARSDGVNVAYQVIGDGPFTIVVVPGFVSHVELNHEYPFFSVLLDDFSSYAKVVILDKRATGLSDRSVELGTFEERMDDVRAVMDDAEVDRASLVGISEGGAMCALMAAIHPDRVAKLVLAGAACPGLFALDEAERDAMATFVRGGWYSGRVLEFFVQHPPDPEAARSELARFERYSCEPAVAQQAIDRNFDGDIRHSLPMVGVPTLVLHNRDDPVVPIDHGEYYATHIPGATAHFADGDFHTSWRPSDYDGMLRAIREFLTGEATPAPRVDRVLATVLFTDIVDSTAQALELGDTAWRSVLDEHDAAASEEVHGHGGILVKSTGDGMLARFDGPSRAVRCADALQRRLARRGLRLRAGAHTGEIELRGDDVGGIGVHVAARVAGAAGPGEVLVSRTVKDLSIGSGLAFEDRGEHRMKGVSEPWQLYSARV